MKALFDRTLENLSLKTASLCFNAPEQTAEAFDEDGFLCTGDAVLFVDPEDPNRGMTFDGRMSEDFKLLTGTWVRAAQLRMDMLSCLGPLAGDLVITGADRPRIGVMVFPVDAERETGYRRYSNDDVAEIVSENSDVLIQFASIDPWKGKSGVREAKRLIRDYGVRGFKFHPTLQGFFPNDRIAYDLYQAIADDGGIALFHTGQTGVGSGMPGGNGMRLNFSNPMYLDDVAVDFPDLKIILAHPSFPWQEEALSVAQHKPSVYIDLSGWSPKYFPDILVKYCNSILREKVLFGSDWPMIPPRTLAGRFRKDRHQGRLAPRHPQEQRRAVAGADGMITPALRRVCLFAVKRDAMLETAPGLSPVAARQG